MLDQFIIQELPKVELHCHLDGSLSLECIRQLATIAEVELPQDNESLKQLVTAPQTCHSLNDYLKVFEVVYPLLQTKEALSLAAYDVVKQAALDNIIYIEVRFAPELSLNQGLTISDTIEAVSLGLIAAQKEFNVVAKLLICGLRQTADVYTTKLFTQAKPYLGQVVVGGDFAGNEKDYSTDKLANHIEQIQEMGFPMTFHAGECECPCPSNISQAIALGLKRIGHGTASYYQSKVIQELIDNEVTLELCLKSNLQTKAAKTLEEFPYLTLRKAGARLTINTDNRTVSQTNLNKEYLAFSQYFDTSISEFYQYNRYAIEASFAHQEEKAIILERLAAGYEDFLS
ncbi:adenosine deaminase [Streptococcus sp. sy004]|uniref:adenosine deaminase n=1 Tax=Streptococcus sp. sy004 TaxID=2600149 RepID=UPI0011B5E94C|nr:adenosine deaminase [Streptococcus sp. sy004]TWT12145.1 adenosine deaminase [Streptococcus sp. sy004]